MYKVIIVDNFNRESVSDRLYKDNLTLEEANQISDNMNFNISDYNPDYYRAVKSDYKLFNAYENLP